MRNMVKRRLSPEAKNRITELYLQRWLPIDIYRSLKERAEEQGPTWAISYATVHRIIKTFKEHGARFSLSQLEEYRNLLASNAMQIRRLWGCYVRLKDKPLSQARVLVDISDVEQNRFRMLPKPTSDIILQLIQDNRQLTTVIQNIDLTTLEAVDLRVLAEYRELGGWPQEQLRLFHGENPRLEDSASPAELGQASDTDSAPPHDPGAP